MKRTWKCDMCAQEQEGMLAPYGWMFTEHPSFTLCSEPCLANLFAEIKSQEEKETLH